MAVRKRRAKPKAKGRANELAVRAKQKVPQAPSRDARAHAAAWKSDAKVKELAQALWIEASCWELLAFLQPTNKRVVDAARILNAVSLAFKRGDDKKLASLQKGCREYLLRWGRDVLSAWHVEADGLAHSVKQFLDAGIETSEIARLFVQQIACSQPATQMRMRDVAVLDDPATVAAVEKAMQRARDADRANRVEGLVRAGLRVLGVRDANNAFKSHLVAVGRANR